MRVTEHELEVFREEHLSPESLLASVERWVYLLVRVAVGVGKSVAASNLILHPRTRRRFDLILYLAPTRAILSETASRLEAGEADFAWKLLEPRPRERCGDLNDEWLRLEAASSAALGREILCARCPERHACEWPKRFKALRGHYVILLAEEQLLINRSLLLLLRLLTLSTRPLVILDEARLLDANYELCVSHDEVRRLIEALLAAVPGKPDAGWHLIMQWWVAQLESLLQMGTKQLQAARFDLPQRLHRNAAAIQEQLWHAAPAHFRYSAFDLTQLAFSRPHERWVEGDRFRFIARPYLGCHVLLLSAHLRSTYASHRLGIDRIASPFEDASFVHTESRIFNVRDRCGADKHFPGNKKRILDTFAVLILRNVRSSRTTVLVSRKKTRQTVAQYLTDRLSGWGVSVQFLHGDPIAPPGTPDPSVIPILHYGILGVNDYTAYETLYCVNSYYVSDRVLNAQLREFEPSSFRLDVAISSGTDRIRRVEMVQRTPASVDRAWLGSIYLRKLEVDPVIQVAGRVRFATKPREVVFFQMAELEQEVPGCRTANSLVELRSLLDVPSGRDVDMAREAALVSRLVEEGLTAEAVGKRLGVSRATVFRRLDAARSLNSHQKEFL